jgi:IS30 family transposase
LDFLFNNEKKEVQMGSYHQLSINEREKIYLGLSQGISLRKIAAELGRSHSTVVREVRRNSVVNVGYLPDRANGLAGERNYLKPCKLDVNDKLKEYVFDKLINCHWSPEQIAGRMKLEKNGFYICKEAIYQYIYSPKVIEAKLYQYLPKKKRKRTSRFKRPSRGGIPNAIAIHDRPSAIETRKYFGHFEGDLVMLGINRNRNITTLIERKTRYAIILYNNRKYSDIVIGNIVDAASKLNSEQQRIIKSITFDRGTEFAKHQDLQPLGIKTFFCDPSAPQQKGANENFNGRLRRLLPRNSYTTQINQQNIDKIQNIMNNTPRKCLNFKTPIEAFNNHLKQWCTSI